MKKNVNDWLNVVLGGFLVCCLLSSMTMFVQAACSGDSYCGKTSSTSTPCRNSTVQESGGKLVCSPDWNPGGNTNCSPILSEDCSSCKCQSKSHPNNPQDGDACSCQ
jgi:hypothetical protein